MRSSAVSSVECLPRLAVALALALGCAAGHGPAGGVATGSTKGAATDTAPSAAFCAALARANDAVLAALPAGAPFALHWRRAAACVASPGGAWGFSLESLRADAEEVWARWSLRHLRMLPDGGAHEAAAFAPDTQSDGAAPEREQPAAGRNLAWSSTERILPATPVLYDFDGDGDAEFIVVVETTATNEAGLSYTTRRGRVWTGRDGIGLYPAARAIAVEDVRDVDGDGRPDLITRGPYAASATVTCGSGDAYPVLGPVLLAHALPGGAFSTSDAVAASGARRECAALPRQLLVRSGASAGGDDYVDLAASARNVACARLWGAAAEPLVSAISSACRQPSGAECAPCDDAGLLERWARVAPPLVLSASEGH